MGTIGGNLLQSTRCSYWRLAYPCRLHGGDTCEARDGEQREHAIFANDFCASAHPSDLAAVLVALGATLHTNRRELPVADLYRVPTAADRRVTVLEPGEVLLELEVPGADRSVYLKAMDRKRFAFPIVGVAAVRRGDTTTVALAGVAPIPWLLEGPLDDGDAASRQRLQAAGCEGPRGSRARYHRSSMRLIAPLAAVLLAAGLLAGCGGEEERHARRPRRRPRTAAR